VHDESVDPHVTAGAAAAMFWRNARAWQAHADGIVEPGEVEELVTRLRARVDDPSLGAIEWRLRRIVLERASD